MSLSCFNYKNTAPLLSISFVCLLLCSLSTVAQRNPTALKKDTDIDDKKICQESSIRNSQFCDYYRAYHDPNATSEAKITARNEMIELLRGQIDTYYDLRKEGRKKKVKWFQTILDILEIGTATAITIMNGERAKSIAGAALNGLQGGRTAVTKNFEILQTQVLINKMNANRAEILTEVFGNWEKPASSYSWYAAKNDLRRYLLAGTFNNALDSLVGESGEDVASAERALKTVEKRVIVGEILPEEALRTDDYFKTLNGLEDKLSKDATKATESLRNIVGELNKETKFAAFLTDKQKLTSASEGKDIVSAIRLLSRHLSAEDVDNTALIEKFENTIIKFGK